jgi:hypothetical protein
MFVSSVDLTGDADGGSFLLDKASGFSFLEVEVPSPTTFQIAKSSWKRDF